MASIAEITKWLGVQATDVSSAEVLRVSAYESASADAVVFATSLETLQAALTSRAGLILASARIAGEATDARLLRVPDARLAFAIVADHLQPKAAATIDPTARIATSATLGEAVTIGPGAVVGEGVTIGSHCSIGARVVIEAGVVLGERVQVQAGVVLGSRGFGYARRPDGSYLLFPQQGALVIEDDVEIGANTTIDRGALGETRIGTGTKIDNLVHIGHNVRIGRNVIIAAQTGISGSSVVEDGAILGGQVGMGEHAIVGPGVILGGGAGVLSNKKLYGANQVFWGRPARPLKQYLRDLARLSRGK
jgi:UDP-3-O-[3-hydroxymyristoyl] glucosamine N-acyltransferase